MRAVACQPQAAVTIVLGHGPPLAAYPGWLIGPVAPRYRQGAGDAHCQVGGHDAGHQGRGRQTRAKRTGQDIREMQDARAVRDLLTFRMGFGQMFAPPDAYPILQAATQLDIGMGPPRPMPPPDEWRRRLGSLPLMHQPGERWMYNTGAGVLGVLVARASGQAFETFLRARLLEPLGMSDTGFSVPADQVHRLLT